MIPVTFQMPRAGDSVSTLVIHDVHVLDDRGGFDSASVDVVVRDGLIEFLGANSPAEPNAMHHDGHGRWLIPGVVDCHAHVTSLSLDMLELMEMPVTRWSIEAGRNVGAMLRAGVTTARDAGGADAGIRESIAAGVVPGPDLLISCTMLSETGGHGDGFLAGPGLDCTAGYVVPDFPGMPSSLVDGPDEMRRKVRQIIRAGGDWIKIAISGGVLSGHDEPDHPQFGLDEIRVAVEEARRKGRRVMAHAVAGPGIDDAIRAGVRSIEHGVNLTEEQAASMAAAGCYLVPTLTVLSQMVERAHTGGLPPVSARKALELEPSIGACVRIAKEHGVPIALGSDFMTRDQHGMNLSEIDSLRRAGLTPAEALLAATRTGQELCERGETHGRIAAGYVFDAVLLGADPGDTTIFNESATVVSVYRRGHLVHTTDLELGPMHSDGKAQR